MVIASAGPVFRTEDHMPMPTMTGDHPVAYTIGQEVGSLETVVASGCQDSCSVEMNSSTYALVGIGKSPQEDQSIPIQDQFPGDGDPTETEKEPEQLARTFFNWDAYLPGFAKPRECADLANQLQKHGLHVGYSNCAGPGILWAYAGLVLLWASFVVMGIVAINTATCDNEDHEFGVSPFAWYPFFPVIALCAWIENRAMNYTAIPRAQLIPLGDNGFHLLGCSAPYGLWLAIMQIISFFKRLDFALDVYFMSELYLSVLCDSSEIDAFFHAHHFDGWIWRDMGTAWVVRLFVFLYFPRLLFALLAITPLSCNSDNYQVPTVRGRSMLDVKNNQNKHVYSTCVNRDADNRFVLTIVAEVGSMASINLEDMKYSHRLQHLMQQQCVSSKDVDDKCFLLWFCLRDVRTQLLRAYLSTFLSGFCENCLQLNIQVLMYSLAMVNGHYHRKGALAWSIVSSIIVCLLKFDQTFKVIRYARSSWSQLDVIAKRIEMEGAEHEKYKHFKMDLRKVRWRSFPLLLLVTLVFAYGVAYATLRFVFVHICDSSMWEITSGCIVSE